MDLMAGIEDTAARFRAGEAEVARTFFSKPRSLKQHVDWLRLQVARELRNLREISQGELTALVDRVDRGVTREEVVAELREHYYETRHYAMLAYVLEGISEEHIKWKELSVQRETADWSEWLRREQKRRREWNAISPLHAAAGAFNSGGAGSVAYGIVGLRGDTYEQLLAETARIILHDEMAHGEALEGRNPLYKLVKTEQDARTALEIIREYSTIRLNGRNFQFGYPLSEERIEAIVRGDIEPATVDTLKAAYKGAIDEEEWFDCYHAAPKPLKATTILR
ncbi:MAG: hypothetical protein ACREQW_21615 [Candidatus Binatia bacterium]